MGDRAIAYLQWRDKVATLLMAIAREEPACRPALI